jgi:hypothetical protein
MSSADQIAYIVTGNCCLRESLRESLVTHSMRVAVFGTAAEYLGFSRPDLPFIYPI